MHNLVLKRQPGWRGQQTQATAGSKQRRWVEKRVKASLDPVSARLPWRWGKEASQAGLD